MSAPRGLIRLAGCSVFGALLAAAGLTAGRAQADPVTNYTAISGPQICAYLDAHPTLTAVTDVINAVIQDSGFTTRDGVRVVVTSVNAICPWHLPLLRRYVAVWAPGGGQVV